MLKNHMDCCDWSFVPPVLVPVVFYNMFLVCALLNCNNDVS